MTIQFTSDRKDMKTIFAIVDRAVAMAAAHGQQVDKQSLAMDLSCVHAETPLRLDDLASATDFNFSHDVFGIARHLNRETGKLEDHFIPRYRSRLAS